MEQNFINENQSQEEPQQNPPYVPNTDSSTSDSTYNSTQNIQPPEQPYYSSQSIDKVQQYPAQNIQPPEQPYYSSQPYPTQNMVVPPNQPYYPPQGATPIQPGVPVSNYPLQPTALNVQPVPQNQYYKPYTLVQHKGIFQSETNTYYITGGFCMKCIPLVFFFMGFFIMLFSFIFLPEALIPFIVGIIFTLISLVLCRINYTTFFILGPNNLTIIQKATCNRKYRTYNQGELERMDLTHSKERGRKKNVLYKYTLNIVRKNGTIDPILEFGSYEPLFTDDEMEFFLYTVNTHIQTKMRV